MNFNFSPDCSCEEAFTKYPSLSAKHYKDLYTKLNEKQRKEFESLSVEKQMGLMHVPVRQQTFYKKNGIVSYLNYKSPARTNNRVTKDIRWIEKHEAKHIVNNEKISLY